MELLVDPSIWIGLLTLVVLEVVLGIDNLVFIAILADKLPTHQRDKARILGLVLALAMRLLMLSLISWLVTLKTPLFDLWGYYQPSGKDLILLGGGLFLLFKATVELHERLEAPTSFHNPQKGRVSFRAVVIQIVALDMVFSLDAVITAVGMVQHLPVMMAAVIIAVGIMILASKPLTSFVSAHPSVIVLCLSFLLMIGFSLVAESFNFPVPKGYLYAAIGFSILIEFFNQVASRNLKKQESKRPLKMRTAETILRFFGTGDTDSNEDKNEFDAVDEAENKAIQAETQNMLYSILTLTDRSVRSIMTPRADIDWIDIEDSLEKIQRLVENSSHNFFPVRCKDTDELIGVIKDKELLVKINFHAKANNNIDLKTIAHPPFVVQESLGVLRLMDLMRQSKERFAFIANEYGAILGIVTLQDIFEAIAGEFPDVGEDPDIFQEAPNVWLVDAGTDLHRLEFSLESGVFVENAGDYVTLGGFLTKLKGELPKTGEVLEFGNFRFEIVSANKRKLEEVKITRIVH
ncbi:TerC family protein [Desulfovibrio litoralis]|uniref:Membrane protein TerC, possibly involved in tellurium resistance n=1 Tax=Desulfovibrio litoralis DSM 11393 TaxID=1121455 RepID=A0A1M7TFZ0_9BACT|nr:TerC family protein [Desulfovibrio litoralis]SHN69637.1 Membrane protein TerC, possibly involved in tellurium resistance [Desulfovibrio litoralis DSM 11393]